MSGNSIAEITARLKGRATDTPENGGTPSAPTSSTADTALPDFSLFPISSSTPEALAQYQRDLEEKLRAMHAQMLAANAERDVLKVRAADLEADNTRLRELFGKAQADMQRAQDTSTDIVENAIKHLESLRPNLAAVTPIAPPADPKETIFASLADLFNKAQQNKSYFDRTETHLRTMARYIALATNGELDLIVTATDVDRLPKFNDAGYQGSAAARLLTISTTRPGQPTQAEHHIVLTENNAYAITERQLGYRNMATYIQGKPGYAYKHMRLAGNGSRIEILDENNKLWDNGMKLLGQTLDQFLTEMVATEFPKLLNNEQMVQADSVLRAAKLIP